MKAQKRIKGHVTLGTITAQRPKIKSSVLGPYVGFSAELKKGLKLTKRGKFGVTWQGDLWDSLLSDHVGQLSSNDFSFWSMGKVHSPIFYPYLVCAFPLPSSLSTPILRICRISSFLYHGQAYYIQLIQLVSPVCPTFGTSGSLTKKQG